MAQRNEPFAPGAAVTTPKKDAPQTNERVQQKRFDTKTVDRPTAPLADRKAPLVLEETRAKSVREKDSHRPEPIEQPTSAYNHKPAKVTTDAAKKPATVAKYQESMASATPWGPGAATGNKPTFAPLDGAATAKINRFVFRKNPAEGSAVTEGALVTPAAGGAAIKK